LQCTNIERELGTCDEVALSQKNNEGGGNDKQMKNIFNHYPNLKKTIEYHNSNANQQF
jgi:hypothetical protein